MNEFPPRPSWKPELKIDSERIIERFSYYSNGNIDFVVFKNGTCVPVEPGSTDWINDSKKTMAELFNSHPDFNPLQMDDGNWMISMSNRAFIICFNDDIEANWDYIDSNHLKGLAEDEVIITGENKQNIFDKRGRIGLFGRAYWFMDAAEPDPVKVIRAGAKSVREMLDSI